MNFVHLHNHSEASIADGLFGVSKWVRAIKEKGFLGHALTDHGTLMNLIPFYHLMKKEGLVPILGCEFYYVDDPTVKTADNRKAQHIILLAKNYDGFLNLLELSRLSYTDGFYYRPRIGLEWIQQYSEGLICSTACLGGVLAHEYWRDKDGDESIGLIKKFEIFKNIFKDDFYVEYQGHNYADQVEVNNYFHQKLKDYSYKPLVTNDCHYILPEHARIQGFLKESAYKSKNSDAGQSYTTCDSLWLKNGDQILDSFNEYHDVPIKIVKAGMENTLEIYEKCKDFKLPESKHYLPVFREKVDSKSLFLKLVKHSLNKLIKSKENGLDYKKRFLKEYKVITKYGLEDYFLIVWDLVRFAKKQGIYTGIGRGSAAGCLISYLLDIVKLDPLEYDLIFERFLNENRCESGELPDIDLDVESLRRDEIKQYILDTYGRDKVCEIGTYGRMKLKTSLIDFGKALKVANHHQLLSITTKIESDSLEDAVEEVPELKTLLLKDEYYCFAVEEIYGQVKSQSVHPAGMIIANKPVHQITPVKTYKDKTGERIVTTQSEDKVCISQGLMKMDILGLKEYDIIKKIIQDSRCDLTVDNYLEKIIEYEEKGLNQEVWKFFQKGWTEGVFQFSSTGMQELLKNIVPDRMNDLIAANALYRPGCLRNGWHDDYCNRKHGREKIKYIHPIIQEITKDTYAICVYQEQVMEIINKLGGVSLVESDNIRSALGKKNEDKLKKYGPMFIEGASRYIDKTEAEKLWNQLMASSEYSFNKCLSGDEVILKHKGAGRVFNIRDMYKIKNDLEYAKEIDAISLRKKFQKQNERFGSGFSLDEDRIYKNRIVDIRYEGEREIYRVKTESDRKIDVTMNHKFPTPKGNIPLSDLVIGDLLYVKGEADTPKDNTYRWGGSNLPKKGEKGFQKNPDSSLNRFKRLRKSLSDWSFCEYCPTEVSDNPVGDQKRKEIHHIDGDHGNNVIDNLAVTCPSCHKKKHYEMGRTKHGERGWPVIKEKIASIEFLKVGDVYDVEMMAPNHNFAVESGIMTSNSHSAAYSILAYVSQFLKVNYPVYFWCAHLEWDVKKNKQDDMIIHRKAAQKMDIKFLPVRINRSRAVMKVEHTGAGKKIRWSYTSIKGIGEKTAKEIQTKEYRDLEDFYKSVNKSKVRFNNMVAMAYAGVFDEWGDRKEVLKWLHDKKGTECPELDSLTLMMKFKEYMGFFEQKIKDIRPGFALCLTEEELKHEEGGTFVRVGGLLESCRIVNTKNGDKMAFGVLVDQDEEISLTFFPEAFKKFKNEIKKNNFVEIEGIKSVFNGMQNQVEVHKIYDPTPEF